MHSCALTRDKVSPHSHFRSAPWQTRHTKAHVKPSSRTYTRSRALTLTLWRPPALPHQSDGFRGKVSSPQSAFVGPSEKLPIRDEPLGTHQHLRPAETSQCSCPQASGVPEPPSSSQPLSSQSKTCPPCPRPAVAQRRSCPQLRQSGEASPRAALAHWRSCTARWLDA